MLGNMWHLIIIVSVFSACITAAEAAPIDFETLIDCVGKLHSPNVADHIIMYDKDRRDKSRLIVVGSRSDRSGIWIFEKTGTTFLPLDKDKQYRVDFPKYMILSNSLYLQIQRSDKDITKYSIRDDGIIVNKKEAEYSKVNVTTAQKIPLGEATQRLHDYLEKFFGVFDNKWMRSQDASQSLDPNDLNFLKDCHDKIPDDKLRGTIQSAIDSHDEKPTPSKGKRSLSTK